VTNKSAGVTNKSAGYLLRDSAPPTAGEGSHDIIHKINSAALPKAAQH
jgi:hypothetical protein